MNKKPALQAALPCESSESSVESLQPGQDMEACESKTGIYFHVPFCLQRCPYCDFFSTVKLELIDNFVRACKQELMLSAAGGTEVDSVYFGGGTPSLLSPGQVAEIIDTLDGIVNLSPNAEITLEANPGTVGFSKLRGFNLAGVNRINLGIQSFNDNLLGFLGRIHNSRQAMDAIENVHKAGFANLGLDLIYGIVGQTDELWRQDLACAVAVDPDHLACYILSIEDNTEFGLLEKAGRCVRLGEEQVAGLFLFTVDFLAKQGWRQYEVSNFAKTESDSSIIAKSRHNWKYWTFQPYMGLGPSAHSFDGNRRRSWNCNSLSSYLEKLGRGCLPRAGEETLSTGQRLLEKIYLGLRTIKGLNLDQLRQEFPKRFEALLPGLLEIEQEGWARRTEDSFRLNSQGMLLLDGICGYLASLVQ